MSDRHDHWNPRLSELLDGTLPPGEARGVQAHLEVCEDCRMELDELRELKARAAALGPVPPARDLWPEISTRLADRQEGVLALPVTRSDRTGRVTDRDRGTEVASSAGSGDSATPPGARSVSSGSGLARGELRLSRAQWGSAAAILVLGSSLLTWWVRPAGPGAATLEGPPSAVSQTARAVTDEGDGRSERLQELSDLLEEAGSELEPRTLRILERNLAVIDQAIEESRRALAEDPSNPFLREHLDRARGRKLSYLEEAAGILARARS